jgi:hypothetical protein
MLLNSDAIANVVPLGAFSCPVRNGARAPIGGGVRLCHVSIGPLFFSLLS